MTGLSGWRVWRVSNSGGLLSVFMMERWPHDGIMQARCRKAGPLSRQIRNYGSPQPTHAAPAYECKCGVYAWTDPGFLAYEEWATHYGEDGACRWRRSMVDTLVLGRVWLWGQVVPHRYGYRAERAQIRSLVGGHPDVGGQLPVGEVAERYRVPVVDWQEVGEQWQQTR